MLSYGKNAFLTAFLAAGVGVGCVSTGSVSETQAPTTKLGTYKTVDVRLDTKDNPSSKVIVQEFTKTFSALNKEKATFSEVRINPTDAKGLVVTLTMKSLDSGSRWMRLMNLGGEAKIVWDGVIEDDKKTKIGAFVLEANSARKSTVSVGGVPLSIGDSLVGRAGAASGAQLSEFLETKK